MLRRIMLLRFRADSKPADIAFWERTSAWVPRQIPTVQAWHFSKLLPEHDGGWHYEADGLFRDADGVRVYNEHPYHARNLTSFFMPDSGHHIGERSEIFLYEPLQEVLREPDIAGIKRSLHLTVPKSKASQFEKALLAQLADLPAVRNWSFGRVTSGRQPTQWTHALELELPPGEQAWARVQLPPGVKHQETAYRIRRSVLARPA